MGSKIKNAEEMDREELLRFYKKKKTEWKEEAAWYEERLSKVREKRYINQIRHLLVENQQLHRELEQAMEREKVWKEVIAKKK